MDAIKILSSLLMTMDLPVNQACLRNQQPILDVLTKYFAEPGTVLEVGCGTAQHAVHMASNLSHLSWLPTDTKDKLDGANLWVEEANLDNLSSALELDVNTLPWKISAQPKYGYCANLIHFVSNRTALNIFTGMSDVITTGGVFAIYGPVNQNGFTSDGNASLDEWLKADINPKAGIKELDDINRWANQSGFEFLSNELMPANNHLLFFKKI